MPFRYSEFQGDHVVKRGSLNCPLVALAAVGLKPGRAIRLFLLMIFGMFATFVLYPTGSTANPGLFGPDGYRVTAYRGKLPESVGSAVTLTAKKLHDAPWKSTAVLLDVAGIRHYDITENGDFITPERHKSIPGAIWLPVIGWGVLEPWQQEYMRESLRELTDENLATPIVVFCKVDCWLGWNVVRRLSEIGYRNIYWFPGGIEIWEDEGYPVDDITPFPLSKDLAARVFIGPSF